MITLSEFKNTYHKISCIVEEREKAICVEALCGGLSGGTFRAKVWLPKSQVKDGSVMGWLLLAKAEEFNERCRMGYAHFIGAVDVLDPETN